MLTLAGCGLHPYPPLLSLPGARQRRRRTSRDEENERQREREREREREILRSVISEKAFILSFLTISPFYELASL